MKSLFWALGILLSVIAATVFGALFINKKLEEFEVSVFDGRSADHHFQDYFYLCLSPNLPESSDKLKGGGLRLTECQHLARLNPRQLCHP